MHSLLITACQEDVDVRDKGGAGVIGVMNSMESEGKFTQFYDAIGTNGLRIADEFNGSGPSYEYTIFAPTDAAFDSFLAQYDTYGELGDIPDDLLRSLIDYHVVAGSVSSGELGTAQTTVQGSDLSFNGYHRHRSQQFGDHRSARPGSAQWLPARTGCRADSAHLSYPKHFRYRRGVPTLRRWPRR